MNELPYIFDLYWDVKTYEQVDIIARGEPDCSEATPGDLKKLFIDEGMEVPKSLIDVMLYGTKEELIKENTRLKERLIKFERGETYELTTKKNT